MLLINIKNNTMFDDSNLYRSKIVCNKSTFWLSMWYLTIHMNVLL